MTNLPQTLLVCSSLIYLSIVAMHLTRKTRVLVLLYVLQSTLLAGVLIFLGIASGDQLLFVAAILSILVKSLSAPKFFLQMIRSHQEYTTSKAYLGTPSSLVVLLCLALLAYSPVFSSFLVFATTDGLLSYTPLYLAGLLTAFFLMIVRRDAVSQILGILALENWIVLIATVIGVRLSIGVELAVAFDVIVWIVVAVVFVSMIERNFGTLNTTVMSQLKEE